MRKQRALAVFILGCAFAFLPIIAAAAGLVPCGGPDNPTGCQACHVVSLLQNVINFLLGLSIPIFIGLFAYAGVLYFTAAAKESNITKAREIFKKAFLGFLVALGAYLIVETVLRTILVPEYYTGWNTVQCVADTEENRPKNKSVSDLFNQALNAVISGTNAPGATGNSGTGEITITTIGPDGKPVTIKFDPTRPVDAMGKTYLSVQSKYGSQINAACANSSLPNCTAIVTAVIVAESGGNPNAVSSAGAKGLMQNTNSACSASNTQCQINEGTRQLESNYNRFNNVPNTLAAYNSGASTQPGQSASGKNSAMVASVNCPGMYAWQCDKNPGGLTETQGYVANICGLLVYEGNSC